MGIGETGVDEMGVGQTETPRLNCGVLLSVWTI